MYKTHARNFENGPSNYNNYRGECVQFRGNRGSSGNDRKGNDRNKNHLSIHLVKIEVEIKVEIPPSRLRRLRIVEGNEGRYRVGRQSGRNSA